MKRSSLIAAVGAAAGIVSGIGYVAAWTAPGHLAVKPHLINFDTYRDKAIPLSGTWNIDPMHTSATFNIRHMGLSNVQGRFDEISGTIVANEEHPELSSVEVTIPATSVDTDVKMRDDDLRGEHYLDVAKYPTITFKSTSVKHNKDSRYTAVGDLTIHGVTKQISLPFDVYGPIKDPFGSPRFGLSTAIIVNRLDYGVGPTDKLAAGQLAVGENVNIHLNVEGTPPAPPANPAPAAQ